MAKYPYRFEKSILLIILTIFCMSRILLHRTVVCVHYYTRKFLKRLSYRECSVAVTELIPTATMLQRLHPPTLQNCSVFNCTMWCAQLCLFLAMTADFLSMSLNVSGSLCVFHLLLMSASM